MFKTLHTVEGMMKMASNPLVRGIIEARLREMAQKDPADLLEEGLAFLGADNVTRQCTTETAYLLQNVRAQWAMQRK